MSETRIQINRLLPNSKKETKQIFFNTSKKSNDPLAEPQYTPYNSLDSGIVSDDKKSFKNEEENMTPCRDAELAMTCCGGGW